MKLSEFKEFLSIYIILVGLLGVFRWRHLAKTFWIIFPIFLILIGALDRIGILLFDSNLKEESQMFYLYLVIPLEFIFYFVLYYLGFHKNKKWLLLSIGIYLLAVFCEPYLKERIAGFYFTSLSFLIGILILLISILIYLFGLSKSEKILRFYHQRLFWISAGLILFWIGSLPYYGLFNYINRNYYTLLINYTWIIMSLNYIMYTFFIFGFKWGKES